jgi:hypothetical protein
MAKLITDFRNIEMTPENSYFRSSVNEKTETGKKTGDSAGRSAINKVRNIIFFHYFECRTLSHNLLHATQDHTVCESHVTILFKALYDSV